MFVWRRIGLSAGMYLPSFEQQASVEREGRAIAQVLARANEPISADETLYEIKQRANSCQYPPPTGKRTHTTLYTLRHQHKPEAPPTLRPVTAFQTD
jgi:hypothetical protein